MIPLPAYLVVGAVLFALGIVGFVIRRSAVIVLMSVELMLNAVNLSFLAFSRHHGLTEGSAFVLFVIAVAAAEAVVGLAILIALFRLTGTTHVDEASELKG